MVELLAAILIMGILMLIGLPNIIRVLNDNKNATYAEDAKKLITLGESKFRSSTSVSLPIATNHCAVATLKFLDNSEFENPPNDGSYDKLRSFVVFKRTNSNQKDERYEYSVQLVQLLKDKVSYKGIPLTKEDNLYNKRDYNNLILHLDQNSIKNFSGIDSSNKDDASTKSQLMTYIHNNLGEDYCTEIDDIYASDLTEWDSDDRENKSVIQVRCDVTSEGTSDGVNLSCSCTKTGAAGTVVEGCPGEVTGLKSSQTYHLSADGVDDVDYTIQVRSETQNNISTCSETSQATAGVTEDKTYNECTNLSGTWSSNDSSIGSCTTYTRPSKSSCESSGGSWTSYAGSDYGTCTTRIQYSTNQSCSTSYRFSSSSYCSGRYRYSISKDMRRSNCNGSCGRNCYKSFSSNSTSSGVCRESVSSTKSSCTTTDTSSIKRTWSYNANTTIGDCTYQSSSEVCSSWSEGTWGTTTCEGQDSNSCKVNDTRTIYYYQN